MDVSNSSYYIFNEKENKGSQIKVAKWGTPKKKEKKKTMNKCLRFCKQRHITNINLLSNTVQVKYLLDDLTNGFSTCLYI
jgi:hypothetical protein